MVHIRPAKPGDMPSIMDLINELAVFEKFPEGVKNNAETLRQDYNDGKFHCFVGCDNNDIVGFAIYVFTIDLVSGKMIYLEDLYVKEKHRKSGIGGKLWDSVINTCKKHKCSYMEFSCLKWNENAIKFYLNRDALNMSELYGKEVFRLCIK